MSMHYINVNGVKGMAMGGVLIKLKDVTAIGGYWPASETESAYFDIMLFGKQSIRATFDNAVPVARHLEEHARLVNAYMASRGEKIEFEPHQKTKYDVSDPDGAWLMTGRAVGAFVAYLYQMDDPDNLSGKEVAIKLAEEFAIKAFGDSMAMDEFADARENVIWNPTDDDPDRLWSRWFGKPI